MEGMLRKLENAVQFQHADPPWRVDLAFPRTFIETGSVLTGDIVYMRRPKSYQWIVAAMGDNWRHVGVATTVRGFSWMIEMNPFGFFARPLETVVAMYDTVAVQRLPSCSERCSELIDQRIIAAMNTPVAFHTKPELFAIGIFSFKRLFPWLSSRPHLWPRLWNRLLKQQGFTDRAACSTPIARVVNELCEHHRVLLDVSSYKRGPQSKPCATGQIQAALPDDIWRALQPTATSYWLKKDGWSPRLRSVRPGRAREELKS